MVLKRVKRTVKEAWVCMTIFLAPSFMGPARAALLASISRCRCSRLSSLCSLASSPRLLLEPGTV
ncbi:hypothetical protein E2C01_008542 [Portunus trituberculatus]|uniref:Uncharacterized protein n=1 Tax=Portunus trituberculatus TaxID=210409 RepID=A0A5B7D3E9_PORTR|nr:hypothetical protein [Portunus trituberculatus]